MYESEFKLQFQVKCDKTKMGEDLYIVGDGKEFGDWKIESSQQKLYGNKYPIWQSEFISFNKKYLEFKYVIKKDHNLVWERQKIGNRKLDLSNLKDGLYLIDDGNFDDYNNPNNQKIININKNEDENDENDENYENDENDENEKDKCKMDNNKKSEDKKDKDKKDDKKIIKKKKKKIIKLTNNYFQNSSKKGLENIGATCYMNSTLQCFCHIEKFIEFFKLNPQITKDNRKDTLSYSFKLLINELWPDDFSQNNNTYYSPFEFKEKISKMNPLFEGVAANDAKDLVNFIIMTLHEELNKANNNSINNSNIIIDQTNPLETMQYFMTDFIDKNKSIISDIFYAMNQTITRCGNCGIQLYNYQIYFFLNFPLEEVRKFKYQNYYQNNIYNSNIINNNVVSIFDCFDYDRKINNMNGDNRMFCNNCRMSTDSIQTTSLMTGPETLIILLNRGKGLEFNVKIIFEENLNLDNYISYKNTGYKYKLIGVITHIGESGMGGHFIAYCREPKTNSWSKYNDAIVTDVKDFQKEVIDFATPYLLFYQKYL